MAETRGVTIKMYEVHTIELRKFHKTQDHLESKLDLWAYYLKNIDKYNIGSTPQAFKKDRDLFSRLQNPKGYSFK
jgi:hypothetical protein